MKIEDGLGKEAHEMKKQTMLYLSQDDVFRTGRLSPSNSNKIIEESFSLVGKDDFLMGGASCSEHGLMIHFPESSSIPNMPVNAPDYRYMAMVGYVGGDFHICGSKVYGSNPENLRRQIPRSNHIIILNDVETGMPVAVMNGTEISNMRTGSVAAVAAKYLAPKQAEVCGLVGAGVINRSALRCMLEALPGLKRVYVYDRVLENSWAFARDMEELPLEIVVALSEEEMMPQCDVIHYATTAIPPLPMVKPELLKPETLVEISSLAEYPENLLKSSNLVVDLLRMHEIWYQTDPGQNLATYPMLKKMYGGELDRREIKELGRILCGEQEAARDGRTTVFMANGLPVWDVALACSVYEAAKKNGIGTLLPL